MSKLILKFVGLVSLIFLGLATFNSITKNTLSQTLITRGITLTQYIIGLSVLWAITLMILFFAFRR